MAHLGRRPRASGSVIDLSQLPSPSPSGSYHLNHSDSTLSIRMPKRRWSNFDTTPFCGGIYRLMWSFRASGPALTMYMPVGRGIRVAGSEVVVPEAIMRPSAVVTQYGVASGAEMVIVPLSVVIAIGSGDATDSMAEDSAVNEIDLSANPLLLGSLQAWKPI